MRLSDFDYHLPKEQVAQYPLIERDSARLFILHRGQYRTEHRIFRELAEYLKAGDVLVLNDTMVIPARLYGKKPGGGKIEVLLIKELYTNTWEALVRRQGRQGAKEKCEVTFEYGISAYISRNNGAAYVKFKGDDIKKYLNKLGAMPLPPYIKRQAGEFDKEHYQTVYAEKEGAVASPTAGLHFTKELLNKIKEKGVEVHTLTLHVGYGTFKPVLVNDIRRHQMGEEAYEIPETTANAVNKAKTECRRVIAVGTTVTRAIEASAFNETGIGIKASAGKASNFIYPGYKFKIIDALITNFHQPKSTPMMLTCAFAGLETLKKAYIESSKAGYRFFSYGDAMMIV
ncbi:MAG: tRNA preQ1(34) S-adenosylmethionine ribosyltransferase-isomerase QueA [Nitrospirae bacterium]|nr:tRNA preQ1(34) S-adenosylmethionine ribosyltransferase-isomerase QueA [Nitrospirota bacterium]